MGNANPEVIIIAEECAKLMYEAMVKKNLIDRVSYEKLRQEAVSALMAVYIQGRIDEFEKLVIEYERVTGEGSARHDNN